MLALVPGCSRWQLVPDSPCSLIHCSKNANCPQYHSSWVFTSLQVKVQDHAKPFILVVNSPGAEWAMMIVQEWWIKILWMFWNIELPYVSRAGGINHNLDISIRSRYVKWTGGCLVELSFCIWGFTFKLRFMGSQLYLYMHGLFIQACHLIQKIKKLARKVLWLYPPIWWIKEILLFSLHFNLYH